MYVCESLSCVRTHEAVDGWNAATPTILLPLERASDTQVIHSSSAPTSWILPPTGAPSSSAWSSASILPASVGAASCWCCEMTDSARAEVLPADEPYDAKAVEWPRRPPRRCFHSEPPPPPPPPRRTVPGRPDAVLPPAEGAGEFERE